MTINLLPPHIGFNLFNKHISFGFFYKLKIIDKQGNTKKVGLIPFFAICER